LGKTTFLFLINPINFVGIVLNKKINYICEKNMISHKCKYAIRALIDIAAQHDPNKPVMSSEIAARQQIPKKFLETILRDLRNSRILHSRRGSTGGYTLLKPASEITTTEIIRIIDGPIALLPCVSLNYYASCEGCDESTCQIKGVFEQVRDKTLGILNHTSLADLRDQYLKNTPQVGDEKSESARSSQK
jgi:Rrf2 family protein